MSSLRGCCGRKSAGGLGAGAGAGEEEDGVERGGVWFLDWVFGGIRDDRELLGKLERISDILYLVLFHARPQNHA